jgi:phage tail sheath gpL-like
MPDKNLTSGQVLPGFYGFLDYNAQGSGQAPSLRALLWGYVSASAQRIPNQPYLPASQQDADDGCGRGSDLASMYAATISQPESQGAEVWLMPIAEPSGGVQSTYKLTVFVSATNPSRAGTIQLWINSQPVPAVGFTPSDTDATIATALASAIGTMLDLPIASATATAGVITIAYRHKGTTGEDFPFRCNISPNGTGVTLSPGQILFATAVTGIGSVQVNVGALAISTAVGGTDTPAIVATKVAASFNSNAYPLTAVVDSVSTATVDLLFNNDYDVRRISAAIITSVGLTANLGSGATDGSGSPTSLTYNGTTGTGAPALAQAVTNLGNLDPFRSWVVPWLDSNTLSTLATNIEASSDGSITGQKQQILTVCDFRPASVAGAIAPDVSPNLTATPPHYAICWSPDVPVKAVEIAARLAAARASKWIDTPAFNWNGFQVRGNGRSPILLPPTIPSVDAQNTALRTYALAPIIVGPSGNMEVVKGRTTSLANDKRLWAWSTEAQAAYHTTDLALFFRSRFLGGSIVRYSEPKAPGLFDQQSFKSATKERMRFWELNGNYDGADALAPSVKATPDVNNPFRMNIEYPESPVLDLDQIVFTGHFTQPST